MKMENAARRANKSGTGILRPDAAGFICGIWPLPFSLEVITLFLGKSFSVAAGDAEDGQLG